MATSVQYHRRFSTYFIENESGYEPIILCYIEKENKLQVSSVGTNEEMYIIIMYMYVYIHVYMMMILLRVLL